MFLKRWPSPRSPATTSTATVSGCKPVSPATTHPAATIRWTTATSTWRPPGSPLPVSCTAATTAARATTNVLRPTTGRWKQNCCSKHNLTVARNRLPCSCGSPGCLSPAAAVLTKYFRERGYLPLLWLLSFNQIHWWFWIVCYRNSAS